MVSIGSSLHSSSLSRDYLDSLYHPNVERRSHSVRFSIDQLNEIHMAQFDNSEITNLLSVTVFLGMVSAITPPTSESIPVIGIEMGKEQKIFTLFSNLLLNFDGSSGRFNRRDHLDCEYFLSIEENTWNDWSGKEMIFVILKNNNFSNVTSSSNGFRGSWWCLDPDPNSLNHKAKLPLRQTARLSTRSL